jgi:PAS domain S-box-containing protein
MSSRLNLLLLEDRPEDAELVLRELCNAGLDFVARVVATEAEFRDQLKQSVPALILSDYTLPGWDGLSALAVAQATCPATPFIFVTGTLGEVRTIQALHLGAADVVTKQRLEWLEPAVCRALHLAHERCQNQSFERQLLTSVLQFVALFEHAPDAIVVADAATGCIREANVRAEKLFGRPRHELAGLHHAQLFPAGHWEEYRPVFERQAEGEGTSHFAGQVLGRAGQRIAVEIGLSVIRFDDGRRVLEISFWDHGHVEATSAPIWRQETEEPTKNGHYDALETAGLGRGDLEHGRHGA